MRKFSRYTAGVFAAAAGAAVLGASGCGGFFGPASVFGFPFLLNPNAGGGGDDGGSGGSGGGGGGGGGLNTGSRAFVDPCTESMNRKFVRISMRNQSEDFVHYFLVMTATINAGANEGSGVVCPDDVPLYTSFGYNEVADGAFEEFGNLCVQGPALIYFHRAGQFRAGGGATLASAIGPAQGTSPTFDSFFSSSGVQVPIPEQIVFQNPGTGEGAQLAISRPNLSPCSDLTLAGDPPCQQDAFYYVDEFDLISGSTAIGLGSGRRVSAEVQGTGCQCLGINDPAQILAPSGVTASTARCNEFLRGGQINFVFLRDDQNPSFPQLVWRVTDSGGAVVQEFDSRATIQ